MAQWVCGSCGNENPDGTRFCGQCGTAAAATWACGSCGNENPAGTRFCGHCGSPAAATAAVPAPPEAPPEAPTGLTEALRTLVAGTVADRLVEHGGQLPEERRLVTALFADVSGFTALSERLDPEELIEVIDPVVSALSSIVGRYDGYVSKYAGDALLALFGAPVAHEDDAARALRVALEMHAELERIKERLPAEAADLTLHIGVNSGHAIARILGSEARMDYSVLGDSVNLAQRLESAAPAGATYVSETTVRLTRHEFEFEPVGELILKGKAEPVPAWRLVGERTTAIAPVDALVGREPELAVVDEALAELDSGRGSVLVVSGEPGIGKSRLTAEALTRARAAGARIMHARCASYGAVVAYAPYVELLRRYLDVRAERRETLALTLEESNAIDALPFFARLLGLPEVGDSVAQLEPEAFRRGLHEAVAGWLRNLADAAPLVLVIEDVHWADPSSLDLTRDVARLAEDRALLVLLVGRPEAQEQVAPIVDGVRHRRLEVGPLDRAGIERLAEATLGAAAGRRLVAFVERRTNGNPFFVQELVRTLKESDALVHHEGGWRLRAGWDEQHLPPTIEGVLTARIDLLPRESATLLQTAAVVGRTVRIPLLAHVVGDEALEPKLDALVGSGFFDRGQESGEATVVFHHALLQDAAYARILRRHRRELHLRVAEVAESLYGSGDQVIDLLARHLYLGQSPKAPDYLVRAGERAKELYANDEAIVHLTHARELRPDDAALGLALAELYELVGSYQDSLELFDALRVDGGGVEAWRGSAGVLRKLGEYERALALIDEALASPGLAGADVAPLWRESGWSLSLMGRLEQAQDVLSTALERMGPERNDRIAGEVLLEIAQNETQMGRLVDALEHGRRALEIYERDGTLHELATALRILGGISFSLDRLDEAAASLRRALELAEQVGAVEEIGACLMNLSRVEESRGNVREAIALDRRVIEEFDRIGHGAGRALGYANLAHDLMLSREFDEAMVWAERATDLARQIGYLTTVAHAIDTTANIHFESGRYREAAERAEEAAALHTEIGAAPDAVEALALAERAWRAAGDDERARTAEVRARDLTIV